MIQIEAFEVLCQNHLFINYENSLIVFKYKDISWIHYSYIVDYSIVIITLLTFLLHDSTAVDNFTHSQEKQEYYKHKFILENINSTALFPWVASNYERKAGIASHQSVQWFVKLAHIYQVKAMKTKCHNVETPALLTDYILRKGERE